MPAACTALTILPHTAGTAVLLCARLGVLGGARGLSVVRPLWLVGSITNDIAPAAAPTSQSIAHLPASHHHGITDTIARCSSQVAHELVR